MFPLEKFLPRSLPAKDDTIFLRVAKSQRSSWQVPALETESFFKKILNKKMPLFQEWRKVDNWYNLCNMKYLFMNHYKSALTVWCSSHSFLPYMVNMKVHFLK